MLKLTKNNINQQAGQLACTNPQKKNMATKANDYVFAAGMRNVYLAKKTKGSCMSLDRRVVTDNEIIGMFEFYLRKWVEENGGEKTVTITSSNGEPIFEATLLTE